MKKIILIGYGGHAKSIADCIERKKEYEIVGYTDVEKRDSRYRYLGTDDVLEEYYGKGITCAVVGIGYLGRGNDRESLYSKLKKIGYELPVIADTSAIISETARIGEGTFVGKGAIINADAVIGKMAIINTMSLVEHECEVGDYSHVAVAAVLCGGVKVGKRAFIGANATVIPCMEVKDGETVPAGATIR